MSEALLETTLAAISPIDPAALEAALQRQDQLTKIPGSLGLLERLGVRLAGISGQCPPPIPEPATVGVFAGDHGVCAQGVTPWPQSITVGMLLNMAAGGAAINVLSRQVGAKTILCDVGVASDYPLTEGVRTANVRRGTADFTVEAAMTRAEALAAVEEGIRVAELALADGARCLLTGEMGIGNTTPASALISVFTGADVVKATGRGSGADDDSLSRKTAAIAKAIELHRPDPTDPLGVLATVGGLEHAALTGFILAGAAHRVPVILDGVIACSAACVAVAFDDAVRGYLIAGHAGVEPGITLAMEHLGLEPLVDVGLRLGEGTGAALALPLVQASAKVLNEMATFAEAGISVEP